MIKKNGKEGHDKRLQIGSQYCFCDQCIEYKRKIGIIKHAHLQFKKRMVEKQEKLISSVKAPVFKRK